MSRALVSIAIVLGTGVAGLALTHCSAGPTRATVEASEDSFCRAVARSRELEKEYGVLPKDAGAE